MLLSMPQHLALQQHRTLQWYVHLISITLRNVIFLQQDDSASSYATFKPAPGAAASSYSSIAPGAPSAAAPAEPGAAALPPLPSAALQGAKAPTERPQLPSAALRPQRQLPLPKFRAWNEGSTPVKYNFATKICQNFSAYWRRKTPSRATIPKAWLRLPKSCKR